ncbi:MAG: DUF885 domain-containing protein, partial [Phycisphaerae bacterium]|nr:DUF885 domain-containing protein [Phycisphaerae bacterium]
MSALRLAAWTVLAALLTVRAGVAAQQAKTAPPPAAPSASQQFQRTVDEYQRWRDYAFPEAAISQGRPTAADRITDPSLRGIEMRQNDVVRFLGDLRAISREQLTAEEQLDWALLVRDLQESVDGHRFRSFLMPVSGRGGPQQDVPQMAEGVPFNTPADYENYLKRLTAVPQAIRDTRALMELGVAEGRVPPKPTMQDLPAQFEAVIRGQLEPLRGPLARMPDTIPAGRQAAMRDELNQSLHAILDALLELRSYLITQYLPACRDTVAASDLPDGAAWYDFALRAHTTTDLNARQIHDTGLAEVARIRAEMLQVIRKTDWFAADAARASLPDDQLFAAFLQYLRTDPRFYTRSEEELLARYRDICKRIDAKLPALFGVLPRNPYGVRAVPRFMAPTQTTAYYQPGSLRAGNPGWFYANTHALDQRPTYEMIPLSLHEAVPGHHLQISIAQELPDQPEYRRQMHVT